MNTKTIASIAVILYLASAILVMDRAVVGQDASAPLETLPPQTLDTRQHDAINKAWKELAGLSDYVDQACCRLVVGSITIDNFVFLLKPANSSASLVKFQKVTFRIDGVKIRADAINVTLIQINQQGYAWRLDVPALTFYVDNEWFTSSTFTIQVLPFR